MHTFSVEELLAAGMHQSLIHREKQTGCTFRDCFIFSFYWTKTKSQMEPLQRLNITAVKARGGGRNVGVLKGLRCIYGKQRSPPGKLCTKHRSLLLSWTCLTPASNLNGAKKPRFGWRHTDIHSGTKTLGLLSAQGEHLFPPAGKPG